MDFELVPVILAGGTGTRLWPLSRKNYAKQYHVLGNNVTMLQATLKRLEKLSAQAPIVICNEETRFLAAEQIRQTGLKHMQLLLEPEGRNTAPAIALAALEALSSQDDSVLLVMPADHQIDNEEMFVAAVQTAFPLASAGNLVTFGVEPTRPETAYGYIKRGKNIAESAAFSVEKFVEKPDEATAQKYINSGNYLWNSGIFMFRADRFLEELGLFRPDIVVACQKAFEGRQGDGNFLRYDRKAFLACDNISIDYAVMEKSTSAVVVSLDAGWNDIGSWSRLWDVSSKNADNNCEIGDVINLNGSGNYINANNRLVVTIGLENMIVMETKDVVFIAPRDKSDEVREVVEKLKSAGRVEVDDHREVYRPWGKYDCIDTGERYLVKRITVNPKAKLSLQKHHHRAEHWIVVKGRARVTRGDETTILSENESTFIPIGEIHALENPDDTPLELIEVQSGTYLGEDDIVRLQDKYGRI